MRGAWPEGEEERGHSERAQGAGSGTHRAAMSQRAGTGRTGRGWGGPWKALKEIPTNCDSPRFSNVYVGNPESQGVLWGDTVKYSSVWLPRQSGEQFCQQRLCIHQHR